MRQRATGHAGIALLFMAALVLISRPTIAQLTVNPRNDIEIIKKGQAADRAAASTRLIEHWQESLDPIIAEIATYSVPTLADKPAEVQSLLNITDVLRSIIVNNDDSIQEFRKKANPNRKAIENLIWAARSDNQGLRLNATYTLANVADNSNLCIVLHHLQDPSLSANGRINLMQVTQVVSTYAYKQNVEATKQTLEIIKQRAKGQTGFNQTLALADGILKRTETSKNASDELPDFLNMNGCKSFDFKKPLN